MIRKNSVKKVYRKNRNNSKKNNHKLMPDMCPQINVDMSIGKGGVILYNNKICVAKPLLKNSHLFKMFNMELKSNKKTYLVKEHIQENNRLDSILFFAITEKEYKVKRKEYKTMMNQ